MSTPTAAISSTQKPTSSSSSTTRRIPSRPTTPLRPSSRSSLRESHRKSFTYSHTSHPDDEEGGDLPLEGFEPEFAELGDSMADLEANFMHLQIMHESLARFSESFGAFLYGLNMNAFCVDFGEAPITDSFKRAREADENLGRSTNSDRFHGEIDGETTFLTTDTSFIENPPTSSKPTPKFSTPAPSRIGLGRGGIVPPAGRGGAARGGLRGTRGSGLARAAKPRGGVR